MRDAFDDILQTLGRKPKILGANVGPEFNNFTFLNYLRNQNIAFYLLVAPGEAVLAERFIQTLKFRIYRYLHRNNTNNFMNAIDEIVINYNYSVHSRKKFKPKDVYVNNRREAYLNLYRVIKYKKFFFMK